MSALTAALLLGGCNATKRELTVVFDSTATDAQRAAALRACSDATPEATPEPVVTPRPGPGPLRHVDVTFRIDSANDKELAHLEACLQQQPGVRGFQDSAA